MGSRGLKVRGREYRVRVIGGAVEEVSVGGWVMTGLYGGEEAVLAILAGGS